MARASGSLTVRSDAAIHALSLLSSPTGHLTNLSTAPSNLMDGVYEVALFPSASDADGPPGFCAGDQPFGVDGGDHDPGA